MLFTHYILPDMRARKEGCIINIASRSGTTTHPFCASYNAAKAALICATAVLQSELEVDGLNNIHMYALHPGANKTGLQGTPPRSHFPQSPIHLNSTENLAISYFEVY
jgi:short-subunit dehydrogenase